MSRTVGPAPGRPRPRSGTMGAACVKSGLDHRFAAKLVANDGRPPEEVVSVGVIAVVMRVDQGANGQIGYSPDGSAGKAPGSGFGESRCQSPRCASTPAT